MSQAYAEVHWFTASLAGRAISFASKPGLPGWDRITPAETLLAEHTYLPERGKCLALGCGHGAVSAALAGYRPDVEFWANDSNFIALQMCAATLQANRVENVHIHAGIDLPDGQEKALDAVLVTLPKGRALARRWLALAYAGLRPGGQIYLAGANDQGIQTSIKDAQALFGNGKVLAYKKGNRVACFTQLEMPPSRPVWLDEPGVAPGTWIEFTADTPQGSLDLCSLPGTFSSQRLDPGTALLLEHLQLEGAGRALDLGCGCGILGIVMARLGASAVDLLDVNLLAVAAANENLHRQQIANARAFPGDALNTVAGNSYSLIASNPPFHAGQAVDYKMTRAFIQGAYQALEPGGRLMLVANRFIRYDRWMDELFGNIQAIAQTRQYHVLQSRRV